MPAANRSRSSSDEHAGTATTAQLFQGYGTHYVDLWCGTPTPQRQTVIVDTGSAMTAFPCRFESGGGRGGKSSGGCARPRNGNCGADGVHHVGTLYNASQSETFATVACPDCLRRSSCSKERKRKSTSKEPPRPCHVEQWYREGSGWEAREVRDVCFLGGFHNAKNAAAFAPTNSHRPPSWDVEIDSVDGLDPSLASRFAFPLQFACQTKVSGAFRTQLADGIMGMQPGVSSSLWMQVLSQSQSSRRGRGGGSIVKAWDRSGSTHQEQSTWRPDPWMEHGAFSLCFSSSPLIRDERLARRGASAGLLTLGGADPRLSTETAMVYTRNGAPPQEGYFGVEIRHVYLMSPAHASASRSRPPKVLRLDKSENDLNRYQVIVDSGSTNTYLTSKARGPFERAWKELVGGHLDLNDRYDSIEDLPTIAFQLKGVWGLNRAILREQRHSESASLLVGATNNPLGSTAIDPDHPHDVLIALPPSQYCEWDARRKSCRLSVDFDSHEDSALGASTLLNHHVLFDAENNRLGWARSSCNYTAIVGREFEIDRKKSAHRGKKIRHSSKDEVVIGTAWDEPSDDIVSVRYDHDKASDAQSTKDNATQGISALNATEALLPTTSDSTVKIAPNQTQESSAQHHHISDTVTVVNPFVRPWWILPGAILTLLSVMWRARRRRPSGGGRGRRDEDLAPLLRKS